MTTVGKTQLTEVISKKSGSRYTKEQIASIIEHLLKEIKASLKAGESVAFRDYFALNVKRSSKKLGDKQCSKHKEEVARHKTANCCDKKKGIKAYAKCTSFKKITKGVRECKDCQKIKEKLNKSAPRYISLSLSPSLKTI